METVCTYIQNIFIQALVWTSCVMTVWIRTGNLMDNYLIWLIFSLDGKQRSKVFTFILTISWMKVTPHASKCTLVTLSDVLHCYVYIITYTVFFIPPNKYLFIFNLASNLVMWKSVNKNSLFSCCKRSFWEK